LYYINLTNFNEKSIVIFNQILLNKQNAQIRLKTDKFETTKPAGD